jgi:hypothetical protein
MKIFIKFIVLILRAGLLVPLVASACESICKPLDPNAKPLSADDIFIKNELPPKTSNGSVLPSAILQASYIRGGWTIDSQSEVFTLRQGEQAQVSLTLSPNQYHAVAADCDACGDVDIAIYDQNQLVFQDDKPARAGEVQFTALTARRVRAVVTMENCSSVCRAQLFVALAPMTAEAVSEVRAEQLGMERTGNASKVAAVAGVAVVAAGLCWLTDCLDSSTRRSSVPESRARNCKTVVDCTPLEKSNSNVCREQIVCD